MTRFSTTALMTLDAVALGATFIASLLFRFGVTWPSYSVLHYAASAILLSVVLVASLHLFGMYRSMANPLERAGRSLLSLLAGALAITAINAAGAAATADRLIAVPILNLALVVLIGTVAVTATRQLASTTRGLGRA